MAKRVLGSDPFGEAGGAPGDDAAASGGVDAKRASKRPASRAPSKAPASSAPKSRASKQPAPKSSVAPSASRASKPSAAPRPTSRNVAGPRSTEPKAHQASGAPVIPPAPGLPEIRSLEHVSAEEERASAERFAAAADLPPDREAAPSEPEQTRPWSSATPSSGPSTEARGAMRNEVRDLEAQLDRLIDRARVHGVEPDTLDRPAEGLESEGTAGAHPASVAPEGAFDVARELLSSEYYSRQWGRGALREQAAPRDEFGMDPAMVARVRPAIDFLYERWWRVEAHNIERVPSEGPVVLCANHSGALPYDGVMLATALRREHPARRELRWLAEDFLAHFPFLGVWLQRLGAVRACQENAERLLRAEACVGVFPEGVKGISKPYRDRYRLQRFGRGGHVKLALRTQTPIVPVAVLGAEETHPLLFPTGLIARVAGLPYVPITPTFPWLGPLGLVPLPSKWRIFFLEPIDVTGYHPEAADDEVLVGRLNERIRGLIQDELDRAVRERESVFKG